MIGRPAVIATGIELHLTPPERLAALAAASIFDEPEAATPCHWGLGCGSVQRLAIRHASETVERLVLSFEWLIDPISPATFFKDYYEKAPVLIAQKQPRKFAPLLSVDVIDRYLSIMRPCFPDVILVDAARELKAEDYSFPNSLPADRVDLPRAYQLFGSGATISLSHLNERLPELSALCRAVERTFSHHFQTNIYLSPPNAQGFKTHYDNHDVFVLQVSGSKLWTTYDTLIELPLKGQVFDRDKHIPGSPTREWTLNAGDVFYCPRGLFHSARSTDEASLHITLGLLGKTWADVMIEAVSTACSESPAFRANLPTGYANPGFDSSQATETFNSLVETFAGNAQLAPILKRFAETFVTSRQPDYYGCLQELDNAPPVSAESKVAPRPHLMYLVREENESFVLTFGSATITLPSFAGEAVKFALRGPPFMVRDLPGDIDDAGKVVLVRRLLKEGLLVRAAGAFVQPAHQYRRRRVNSRSLLRDASCGLQKADTERSATSAPPG